MIEQLVSLKHSIRNKKPKSEVQKKFIEYTNAYDNHKDILREWEATKGRLRIEFLGERNEF